MATTIGGDSINYPDGSQQTQKKVLVKTRYTSHPTVNLSLPTWGGETNTSPELDMGVPENQTIGIVANITTAPMIGLVLVMVVWVWQYIAGHHLQVG